MTSDLLYRILDQHTSQEEIIWELNQMGPEGWDTLQDACLHQGVKPLVYSKLKTEFEQTAIPAAIRNNLHDAYLNTAVKNTLILHHAASILRDLKSKNIDAIGLKGIYLVENIYDNIAARPFGDIDFMVKKEDLQKTIGILKELGYAMTTYFEVADDNMDIKHVPPMFNADGLPVEIHWTILGENEPFSIAAKGLWERAIPANIAGVEVLSLSPEDLILHLCMHLSYQHHLKLGLRGLYDIAKVLEHNKGHVDWTKLVEISKTWGSERVTWLSLMLTEDLLGAQIPPMILEYLQPKEAAPWVLAKAKAQLLEQDVRKAVVTPDLAKFATKEGLVSRIKLLLSRLFLPKQTLARLYGVSPKSIKIYGCYFKRLIYLIIHYGDSLKRVAKKDPQMRLVVENEITIERLKKWMVKNK